MSEWFKINVGISKGCVMSPSIFNVYMDDVGLRGECLGTGERAGVAECEWWQV